MNEKKRVMLKGIMFTEYFREALAIYTNRNLIKGKKKKKISSF